jgi:RNA polymerase sigma-70 factor, ECF subfamily
MNRAEASELVHSLFSSWYPTLVRYAIRATGSREAAEDVVQETFMLLYRALRQGQSIDNPKGWTLCVVRRQIARQQRSIRRELERLDSRDVLEYLQAGRMQSGLPEPGHDEASRLLAVLSPREGEVVLLRMQAMKYREIGVHLGISTNSVSTLLARALRKMQKAAGSAGERIGNALDKAVSKAL